MASVRFVDPGWEHGTAQDERKKKVRCNYCGKVVSGGIYRLKQHLARVSGEVTYCDKAPEEVCLKMKENLQGCRKPKQIEYDEQAYLNDDDVEDKGKQLVIAPLRSLGYVDPGWEHGVAQDERKKKVKCNYCDKIVSGGINRFKQHLARIPGEVAPCKSAPEEVYLKIKENMKWHRTGRRHTAKQTLSSSFYMHSENEEDDLTSSEKLLLGDKRFTTDPTRVVKRISPTVGMEVEPLTKKPKRKEVISAICKFFYHAGVPPHAANSPYFHKMLEMVGQYGQDLPAPPSHMIWGRFLQDEILTIKTYLAEYKASWAITGCSILADSWKDAQSSTLINILVSCPRGMHFVCSVDATEFVDDATALFKLFDKVVEEMGEENIVQVITQNTPTYQAAGKMLEEKRHNLFWTPCAAYCIEQMLQDFVKIKWVAECIEKGQKITKLVYNHIWLSNLMKREYTGGQELLRASFSCHASGFLTLQSLMDHRVALKRLFQSTKWRSCRVSKSEEGEEVGKILTNATFWKKVQSITRWVEPILEVLQNDESLSMPCVYNDLYKAKVAINGDDARGVIDHHWNSLLSHPLYLAAYFLNPSYRYRPDFVPHPEIVRGLNSCIVRFEPNNARRVLASKQISDFGSAKADFGTDLAVSTRTEVNPGAWWQQHGINCLELQRIAVRILSQTSCCLGCEHNWSIYDEIHKQRHNRLAQKRLNDFIYVHYNLRLRRKMPNTSSSLDTILQGSLLHDWIDHQDVSSEGDDENENEANGLQLVDEPTTNNNAVGDGDEDEDDDDDDDLNFQHLL